jgi:hypothetical protein
MMRDRPNSSFECRTYEHFPVSAFPFPSGHSEKSHFGEQLDTDAGCRIILPRADDAAGRVMMPAGRSAMQALQTENAPVEHYWF